MQKKLIEMLHMEREPVGIYFANTETKCDMDANPEVRNCVMPLLMKASEGQILSMDEKSCNCAGGAVGCCFGDGFARWNPSICRLLSQGYGEDAPEQMPAFMKEGERFFSTEELAEQWKNALPYSEKAYPRIVFAPMSRWNEDGIPDLVYLFVNPDQMGALVGMLCSHNGRITNTIAPYGSACQSILFGAEQMEQEQPKAVMGLFDISQRYEELANLLSLTMPYSLWLDLSVDLEKSSLTTHSWRAVEKRMSCSQDTHLPELHTIISEKQQNISSDEGAAVFSGKLNHANSRYYVINDFYNMESDDTLHILTHFKTYQQTKEYTCGACSALMVLNWFGATKYHEQAVEQLVESHHTKGTSVENLADFFDLIGWNVESHGEAKRKFESHEEFEAYVIDHIDRGIPIMIDWVDWAGHWQVLIGIDTCGTDDPYDDVLIFEDPYDITDHFQDGYYTFSLGRFLGMWREGPCAEKSEPYQQPFVAAWPETNK